MNDSFPLCLYMRVVSVEEYLLENFFELGREISENFCLEFIFILYLVIFIGEWLLLFSLPSASCQHIYIGYSRITPSYIAKVNQVMKQLN